MGKDAIKGNTMRVVMPPGVRGVARRGSGNGNDGGGRGTPRKVPWRMWRSLVYCSLDDDVLATAVAHDDDDDHG